MNPFQLGTAEQMLRIGAQFVGGILLGEGVASSAEFQAGVGALISAASFVWWVVRQRQVSKNG